MISIIGPIITGIVSIGGIFLKHYLDKKDEKEKEEKEEIKNKGELYLENTNKIINNTEIETFLIPYDVDFTSGIGGYNIVFPDGFKNKRNHRYMDFYLKNIGNSDINELYICSAIQEKNMVFEYNMIDNINENSLLYSAAYDTKIRKSRGVTLRIYYLKDYCPVNLMSCTLLLIYKDSYNNYYEQPFFYEQNKLYEPRKISYKEFRSHVSNYKMCDYYEQTAIFKQ